jgi:FlaG/FlaF family flagellin (archaellin)
MFFLAKSKKGISVLIGYVVLVAFVVFLAAIIYEWMHSYVPLEELTCPDSVSLLVEKYECEDNQLKLELKNNGKFNLGGYFIYATQSPNVTTATKDLSVYANITSQLYPTGIKLGGNSSANSLKPGEREINIFDLSEVGMIYSIEIVPIRWLKDGNIIKLASCKDSMIKETIFCKEMCIPESLEETCFGMVCGKRANNCLDEVNCGDCTEPELCNANGQCVLPEDCNDTCEGYDCGEVCGEVCGEYDGGCNLPNTVSSICSFNFCIIGGECLEGYGDCDGIDENGCETFFGTDTHCAGCNDTCIGGDKCVDQLCVSCNGVWSPPEDIGVECDGTPLPAHCLTNCTCANGYESNITGGCNLIIPESVGDCADYCDLFEGYNDGGCMQNPSQCTGLIPQGTYIGDIPDADATIGNGFCNIGNADTCCCQP